MKKEIIYIAGKITGDPNYKQKFYKLEAKIRSEGNIVLNPSLLPSGMTNEKYMKICFSMIDCADKVVFMNDVGDSMGASLELSYCIYTAKPYELLGEL